MRYECRMENRILACYCGDDLTVQANALLDNLQLLNARGPRLHDGSTIRFGWSLFRIVEKDAELIICEPDFDGNPFENVVADVDRSLRVQAEQVAICKLAGAVGEPDVRFDQTILVDERRLNDPMVYLDRRPTEIPEFSGWYIGPSIDVARGADADGLEIVPVCELIKRRRPLLSVLQLPADYLAIFDGDEIHSIFDSTGQVIWEHAGAR
jgi:hypothetical protein